MGPKPKSILQELFFADKYVAKKVPTDFENTERVVDNPPPLPLRKTF